MWDFSFAAYPLKMIEASDNFKRFYKWAESYAFSHNKKIDIRQTFTVKNNGSCLGFCDGNKIVVAAKQEFFHDTFIHEFCHLMQAVEESCLWNHDDSFFDDVFSNSVSMKSWNSFLQILMIEHDAEFRALKLIKKWKLGSVKEYSQRANAYLSCLCYMFIDNSQKSLAIKLSDISGKMPEKLFNFNELKKINMNTMELIFEKC